MQYAWIFPGAALRGHPHAIWALQRPTDQYEGPNVHVTYTYVCVYYEYEGGFSYVLRLFGVKDMFNTPQFVVLHFEFVFVIVIVFVM